MHDKRTALARDIRAQIDKVFGKKVFRTVITKSVRLEEAQGEHVLGVTRLARPAFGENAFELVR
jgi:cellulose biosynthesis protein BcsQ